MEKRLILMILNYLLAFLFAIQSAICFIGGLTSFLFMDTPNQSYRFKQPIYLGAIIGSFFLAKAFLKIFNDDKTDFKSGIIGALLVAPLGISIWIDPSVNGFLIFCLCSLPFITIIILMIIFILKKQN